MLPHGYFFVRQFKIVNWLLNHYCKIQGFSTIRCWKWWLGQRIMIGIQTHIMGGEYLEARYGIWISSTSLSLSEVWVLTISKFSCIFPTLFISWWTWFWRSIWYRPLDTVNKFSFLFSTCLQPYFWFAGWLRFEYELEQEF